ncbi:MAG: AAA family ATPase [Desulfobacterales bacterium]|nr:AAA family ATPase [Desulfobacterales bacterium]
MRITEIKVEGLFRIFDHAIPLNTDERITIIHGPNGFGKTVLLRMLDCLFNGHYPDLLKIPFRKFEVRFEDNSVIWIDSEKKINYSKSDTLIPLEKKVFPAWFSGIRKSVDTYLITEQRLHDIQEPFSNFEVRSASPENEISNLLIKLKDILQGKAKTLLVVPMVKEYSEELAKTIQQKLAESAALSQSLDQTFPRRLVEQMGRSKMDYDELQHKLNELEEKRSRLIEVGLVDKQEDTDFLPAEEIADTTKDVLAVYIEDIEKKLGVFDELAVKIELFKRIINDHFLYKTISISKEHGFIFNTSDENSALPLDALSSGEQHELVILYQLLFKAKPDTLILIDEPELSLHVAWQIQFLQDLQEIIKIASLDVLIATHSPQLIHDRWDLTVELKGSNTA